MNSVPRPGGASELRHYTGSPPLTRPAVSLDCQPYWHPSHTAIRRDLAAAFGEPYSRLAIYYDALLGDWFFPKLQRVFKWLVRTYDVRFASAADVACGTGRFVRYLEALEVPIVFGVDRSIPMLEIAMARNPTGRARFFHQDFVTLALPHPVDLITCNFDSLNYILKDRELVKAITKFRQNLRPNGHVIFDMITDAPTWPAEDTFLERRIIGDQVVARVMRWFPRLKIQHTSMRFGVREPIEEIHIQRGYSEHEVLGALHRAGLVLRVALDFERLGAVGRMTTRAIYVARRGPGRHTPGRN